MRRDPGVPIARRDNHVDVLGQPPDRLGDLVTALHGKRAAGAKVVLNVDDDQSLHLSRL